MSEEDFSKSLVGFDVRRVESFSVIDMTGNHPEEPPTRTQHAMISGFLDVNRQIIYSQTADLGCSRNREQAHVAASL